MDTDNRMQRWSTILLNYNFKMEYLPSKKFSQADRLSKLIPKYKEPLEDTVITSLQFEGELKITLCNSVRELPVTLDQNYAKAVPCLLRYLLLNSTPGQKQTFHGLGYTLTLLAHYKDFTILL